MLDPTCLIYIMYLWARAHCNLQLDVACPRIYLLSLLVWLSPLAAFQLFTRSVQECECTSKAMELHVNARARRWRYTLMVGHMPDDATLHREPRDTSYARL